MAEDLDARTEPAGRKRQEEAFRGGALSPGRTLLAAASTSAGLAVLAYSLPATFVTLRDLLRGTLDGRLPLSTWGPRFWGALGEAILPTALAVVLASFGAGLWATRARLRGWSLRRPGGAAPLGTSLVGAFFATAVGLGATLAVGWLFFRDVGAWAGRGPQLPLPRLVTLLGRGLRTLAVTLSVGAAAVVVWELARNERRRRRLLFLTPREAREQTREEEGAPLVKAARRARQQEAGKAGKSTSETRSDA